MSQERKGIMADHKERSKALNAVIAHASDMGIEAAIQKHGAALGPTETAALRKLNPNELHALKTVREKIGDAFGPAADNNNI